MNRLLEKISTSSQWNGLVPAQNIILSSVEDSQPETKCKRWSKPHSEYIEVEAIYRFDDFAVVAAWLQYRKDADQQSFQKKNIMDYLDFKFVVAKRLLVQLEGVKTEASSEAWVNNKDAKCRSKCRKKLEVFYALRPV